MEHVKGKLEIGSSGDVFGLFDKYGDLVFRTPAAFEGEEVTAKLQAKVNVEHLAKCWNEHDNLAEDVKCFEAMKKGVQIRIDDFTDKIARLEIFEKGWMAKHEKIRNQWHIDKNNAKAYKAKADMFDELVKKLGQMTCYIGTPIDPETVNSMIAYAQETLIKAEELKNE